MKETNDKKPFTKMEFKGEYSKSMQYKVHGYWSTDYVTVYQFRDSIDEPWRKPYVKWASGGDDSTEEPDRATAAGCFAQAVADAVQVCREWESA